MTFESAGPLDTLFDLRGLAHVRFGTWGEAGALRVRLNSAGSLSAEVWFPPETALDRISNTEPITHIRTTLEDGRSLHFTPSNPLSTGMAVRGRQLRLELAPSRAVVGPYPKGAFNIRTYLTNITTRGGGVDAIIPSLGWAQHRPMPLSPKPDIPPTSDFVPSTLTYLDVHVPYRVSHKRAQHLIRGHLLRLSLASGSSVEPVATESRGRFGSQLELVDSVARPPGTLALIPEHHDGIFQWFEFAEATATRYEQLRALASLDQIVRALADVLHKHPPYLETRMLLLAALLEALTKEYSSIQRHSWKTYRGGLSLMLQGILSRTTIRRIKDTRTAMVHSVTSGASAEDYFILLGAVRYGLLRLLGYRGPVYHPWEHGDILEFPPKQPL